MYSATPHVLLAAGVSQLLCVVLWALDIVRRCYHTAAVTIMVLEYKHVYD